SGSCGDHGRRRRGPRTSGQRAQGGSRQDDVVVRVPEPAPYSLACRRAVTSISMRIRGSASPAEIIVAAGRISPRYFFRIGQQGGKSFVSGRIYVTRTTSRRLAPACSRADWMFRRHCSAWSVTLSEIVIEP